MPCISSFITLQCSLSDSFVEPVKHSNRQTQRLLPVRRLGWCTHAAGETGLLTCPRSLPAEWHESKTTAPLGGSNLNSSAPSPSSPLPGHSTLHLLCSGFSLCQVTYLITARCQVGRWMPEARWFSAIRPQYSRASSSATSAAAACKLLQIWCWAVRCENITVAVAFLPA